MISYAQNAEDVVLNRAFAREDAGFYIDVGASDPTVDSVTKHFYDHGWSGINIEPAQIARDALLEARPRDLTLGVGLGRTPGEATFYEMPFQLTGCSSFSPEIAARFREDGWVATPRSVELTTLAQVCEEHVGERPIAFLKIDVEGAETDVLAGADFGRFRPRVVVVEATLPGTQVPSHEHWEPGLLRADYRFALFDGLNRFYVREEDAALHNLISAPANVLDDYIPFRCAQWREEASQRDAAMARAASSEQALASSEQTLASSVQALGASEQALAETRAELARSQAALRDATTELAAARRALEHAVRAERLASTGSEGLGDR